MTGIDPNSEAIAAAAEHVPEAWFEAARTARPAGEAAVADAERDEDGCYRLVQPLRAHVLVATGRR